MDKSEQTTSKIRRIVNEIKFRVGCAAGLVLIILSGYGVFWLLAHR
jgi:hypothetical protein